MLCVVTLRRTKCSAETPNELMLALILPHFPFHCFCSSAGQAWCWSSCISCTPRVATVAQYWPSHRHRTASWERALPRLAACCSGGPHRHARVASAGWRQGPCQLCTKTAVRRVAGAARLFGFGAAELLADLNIIDAPALQDVLDCASLPHGAMKGVKPPNKHGGTSRSNGRPHRLRW